jgi:molybdate transport system substrate-binding protein
VRFEAVGGVDAAKRVAAGEAFDVVVLAADAIAKLEAAGHVRGHRFQAGKRQCSERAQVE